MLVLLSNLQSIDMGTLAGSNNLDLIWTLNHITDKARAKRFLKNFENRLCVYSPSVSQLYTRYDINLPVRIEDSLVVFPDYQDITATYSHISSQAIVSTNIFLVPGEAMRQEGLFIVIKPKGTTKPLKAMPLMQGLKKVQQAFGHQDPFLPIIMKGGLREIGQKIPCLNLSRIKLSALDKCSKLECISIRGNIIEKLGLLEADCAPGNVAAAF
ncbi:MAG: hypothetical protein RPR40_08040 [Bermanella sp.]